MAPQKTAQEALTEMEERVKKTEADIIRLKKSQSASHELGAFESSLMAKAESWMIAARNVGSAYRIAAEKHKSVLNEQKASDALSDQMLFSILSIATVGTLSWISSAIQARNASTLGAAQHRLEEAKKRLQTAHQSPNDARGVAYLKSAQNRVKLLKTMPKPLSMIVEALEDTLQIAADKALTTLAPALSAEKLVEASEDPQVFQNEEENKISRVKQLAFQTFSNVKTEWKEKPLKFWDTYDAAAATKSHAEWQREAMTLAGAEALATVAQMHRELETAIWAKYILEKHYHRYIPGVNWKITGERFDYVGDEVLKRLHELDITVFANISESTYKSAIKGETPITARNGESEIVVKLSNWAKSYRVTDLLYLKKSVKDREDAYNHYMRTGQHRMPAKK